MIEPSLRSADAILAHFRERDLNPEEAWYLRYNLPRLRFVGSLARSGGHVIVQTPNAAALHKRLELLVGRNPYGPVSDSRTNPLHFREYTIPELLQAGTEAGIVPREWAARNYFAAEGA